ncbi:MAG: hypothetical protein JXR63_02840 [Spirochaetales bacterium]|nr:hypothetical protein [Spirochaetales bacterium]
MSFNNVVDIDNLVKIRTVLISVSDKTGIEEFVAGLISVNPKVTIYSTGGTFNAIKDFLGSGWSNNLVSVSNYTGQPEMQGGLVKTLDFKIYMGILSETYNRDHREDMERVGASDIDMVVVNLYPFQQAIKKSDVTPEIARGNIDIGGPCMCRASAKNFIRVASVCDPSDYSALISEMKHAQGCLSLSTRFNLAKKSFEHTANYDRAISDYLGDTDFSMVEKIYNCH